jgi:putative protease
MIDHIDDLMDAGVDCLKLEGRAKSAYYAAIVTGAYRHVIDDVAAGHPVDPVWRDEVEHVSHRHYSTGFYYGQPGQYYQNSRYIRDWQICAVVTDCDESGNATLSLRNKFAAGDEIEAVGPDLCPFAFLAGDFLTPEGERCTEVKTPQSVFQTRLPRQVPPYTILRHRVELSAR